jgi:DNA-binding transcriptional MerR regulator
MAKREYSKLYKTIGEVAEALNVKTSHIRFLEKNFALLQKERENNKNRKYSDKDIANLQLILHLTKDRRLTIEGAQKYLQNNKKVAQREFVVVQKLQSIKEQLLAIKSELE